MRSSATAIKEGALDVKINILATITIK
jgi:hypothetical protein